MRSIELYYYLGSYLFVYFIFPTMKMSVCKCVQYCIISLSCFLFCFVLTLFKLSILIVVVLSFSYFVCLIILAVRVIMGEKL